MRAWALAGLALGSVALGAAVGEAYLRATGRLWRHEVPPGEPVMLEADPVLGWRGKPGVYLVPAYGPGGSVTRVTILGDGRRSCGPAPRVPRKRVSVVGCSYTHGVGLSDGETYAWKLQSHSPRDEFSNYGVPAYGTYQSLLALERRFARPGPAPDLVFYGFIQHHEMRNVADPWWLAVLGQFSRRGHVSLPYCLLGPGGKLERRPPEAYSLPELDKRSALVFALRTALMRRKRLDRFLQARPVTERLILEMSSLCRRNRSRLVVVLLDAGSEGRRAYSEFLRKEGVDFVDCSPEEALRPELQVPGEGHPNSVQNDRWARCIEKGAAKFL